MLASSHQIHIDTMSRKIIILISVVTILLVAIGVWWFRMPVVEIVSVTRGPAVEAVYATGIVEPTVMLPIAPRSGAHLVQLNADEGNEVKKGQLLARLDDSDLASTVNELTARERYAKAQLDRTHQLVQRKFLASAELDRVRSEFDAATAALKRAQSQRGFLQLTAPADGVIIKRDGEVGQFIPQGQAIFFMACCAPLRITAEVDEEDIARIHIGQFALLRSDALPQKMWNAVVAEITPKGDPVTRSYRVRLSLKDSTELRVGMTADVNIIIAQRENALLLSTSAINKTNSSVWVVQGNKLHQQKIQMGVSGLERTEIISGIDENSKVILSPKDTFKEGQRVRVGKLLHKE